MDPHLADLRFNKPNFGDGIFCKYWTIPAKAQKSGKYSPVVSKIGSGELSPPWGEIIDVFSNLNYVHL
jgi:hypothetical protein